MNLLTLAIIMAFISVIALIFAVKQVLKEESTGLQLHNTDISINATINDKIKLVNPPD